MLQKYMPNTGRNDLDRFLERTFGSFFSPSTSFWSYSPTRGYTAGGHIPVDLTVEGNNVLVHAELPGIDSKNITVEVDKNMLKIEANIEESTEDDSKGFVIKERHAGSRKRVLRLPHVVDPEATTSTYKDGVLQITLPKVERSEMRQIPIN